MLLKSYSTDLTLTNTEKESLGNSKVTSRFLREHCSHPDIEQSDAFFALCFKHRSFVPKPGLYILVKSLIPGYENCCMQTQT